MFSNKPQGNYTDYYHKFTRYIQLLSAEAQAVDPTATAATFRKVAPDWHGVFNYADTNASRANITGLSDKFVDQRVGIVGLGGTGTYILDMVAKTPVKEIHLYDGDVFCQHNAFEPLVLQQQKPLKPSITRQTTSNRCIATCIAISYLIPNLSGKVIWKNWESLLLCSWPWIPDQINRPSLITFLRKASVLLILVLIYSKHQTAF